MKLKHLIIPTALSFLLSGCVIGAVADLAATTVVTAGKIAVKGTGALISAAIPDGDDKEQKKETKKKNQPEPQPISHQSTSYPNNGQTSYIQIDPNGKTYESDESDHFNQDNQ